MATNNRLLGKKLSQFYGGGGGGSGNVIYQGAILVPADFPLPSPIVQIGWEYSISAVSVTDNDPSRTNTGQTFTKDQFIIWNGSNWSLVSSDAVWADNGTNLSPLNPRSVNLVTGQTFKVNNISVIPTANQKAALDGANNPTAGNVFATMNDVTSPNHNSLTGLQGGAANQYYHFNSIRYAQLNSGSLSNDNVVITGSVVQGSVLKSVSTLPIILGGTNSTTALTNGKVMVSAAGAIVEATALPAGTTAVTQLDADSSTLLATTAYVHNHSMGGGDLSGTLTINRIPYAQDAHTLIDSAQYSIDNTDITSSKFKMISPNTLSTARFEVTNDGALVNTLNFWTNATKIGYWFGANQAGYFNSNGTVADFIVTGDLQAANLTSDISSALNTANSPSATNVFATMADIGGGGETYLWDGAVPFSVFYTTKALAALDHPIIVTLNGSDHSIDDLGAAYTNLDFIYLQAGSTEVTITIEDGVTMTQLPHLLQYINLLNTSTTYVCSDPSNPDGWYVGYNCSVRSVGVSKLINITLNSYFKVVLDNCTFGTSSTSMNLVSLSVVGASARLYLVNTKNRLYFYANSIFGIVGTELTVQNELNAISPVAGLFSNFLGTIIIASFNVVPVADGGTGSSAPLLGNSNLMQSSGNSIIENPFFAILQDGSASKQNLQITAVPSFGKNRISIFTTDNVNDLSQIYSTASRMEIWNNSLNRLSVETSGVVRAQTAAYETLVLNDQDFVNKKYGDLNWGGGGGGSNEIIETLTIATNGQTAFTLTRGTPISTDTFHLFLNGQRVTTFSRIGTALTWTGIPLITSDQLIATYNKVDASTPVTSVFGRTAAVIAASGDYAAFYEPILTKGNISSSNLTIGGSPTNSVIGSGVTITAPVASTSTAGITTLSNSYIGTSQVLATTEKALSDGLALKQNKAQKSVYMSVETGTVLGTSRTRAVAGGGNFQFDFAIPSDWTAWGVGGGMWLLGYPEAGAAGSGKDIDRTVNYNNGAGQARTQYTASDTATVWDLTAYNDKEFRLPIHDLLQFAAAETSGGLMITQNAIGGTINWQKVLIKYQ